MTKPWPQWEVWGWRGDLALVDTSNPTHHLIVKGLRFIDSFQSPNYDTAKKEFERRRSQFLEYLDPPDDDPHNEAGDVRWDRKGP